MAPGSQRQNRPNAAHRRARTEEAGYLCVCNDRDVECGNGLGIPCAARKQVVVVPTVLKGLSNQRMRIISDIVGAVLIGAAVQLPTMMAGRRSCHFRVECYKTYEPALPLWDVFDQAATLQALRRVGVCIMPPRHDTPANGRTIYVKRPVALHAYRPNVGPLRTPIATSHLELLAMNGSLVHSEGQPLERISFGGSADCCVLFVPDSIRARRLFRLVNAAFKPAPALSRLARAVTAHFHEATGGSRMLALHWRAETDMTQSFHALNTTDYVRGVIEVLAKQRQGSGPVHCIVLGDQDEAQTRAITARLGASSWLTLHSKATLIGAARMPRALATLPSALATFDDFVGMVDFEIGVKADLFIGAPFSSFSVMIALVRAASDAVLPHSGASAGHGRIRRQEETTLMATGADTVDRLGEIFTASFPFRSIRFDPDPCAALLRAHPAYVRVGLASCRLRGLQGVKRLSLPKCDSCGVPWCAYTPPPEIARTEKLFHKIEACASRGSLVTIKRRGGWGGCDSLDAATATQNVVRNPKSREMFYRVPLEPELLPLPLTSLMAKLQQPGPRANRQSGRSECSRLAPRFVFDPPLDHRLNCHLAVVTSTFGTRDTIGRIDREDMDKLAAFEQTIGLSSCWFAFVDEAAFSALRALHHNVPDAAPSNAGQAAATHLLVRWGLWNLVVLPRAMLPFEDASLNSRLPKLLLHQAFGSARYVLYIDAKLRFKPRSPQRVWYFVSDLIFGQTASAPAWVSPKHPKRRSIYEEARCVAKLGLASKALVQRQIDKYAAEKFPTVPVEAGGPGLIEGEWHLRDLGSSDQASIGCAWLQEFLKRGHRRDQLSFNYAVWKLGLLPNQRGNRTLFVQYGFALEYFHHVESTARKEENKWRQIPLIESKVCV